MSLLALLALVLAACGSGAASPADSSGGPFGAGAGDEGFRYLVFVDEAWMDMGGMVMPLEPDEVDSLYEDFSPATMFSDSYLNYLDGMTLVGEEEKNGVATRH